MTQDALDAVREQLDQLDERLVTLLARREALVREAGAMKTDRAAVRDPARVEQVVERAVSTARRVDATPEVVERTCRAMISAFVDLELRQHSGPVPACRNQPDRPTSASSSACRGGLRVRGPALRRPPPAAAGADAGRAARRAGRRDRPQDDRRLPDGGRRPRARASADVLHIGRLPVAPDWQGQGIGSVLLRAVETAAGSAREAALFTGARSTANLRLYARHGYVEQRRERLPGGIELVHLSKPLPAAADPHAGPR